jgi:hypothetical protein
MHPYTIAERIKLNRGYNNFNLCFGIYHLNCEVMVYGEAFGEDKLFIESFTALVTQNGIEVQSNIDEKQIIKHLKQKWQQQSQSQQS